MIMMSQCKFISCNKYPTLVQGVDSGGGGLCMCKGYKSLFFLFNFAKTTLKIFY